MTRLCTPLLVVLLFPWLLPPVAKAQNTPVGPATTTTDISFKSHDGYEMRGRLTLPNTLGRHPILLHVQTAEAAILDGHTRNAKGERVPFYDLYRDNLAPLNIGFFSYEGRGVTTGESGVRQIDPAAYNTSTLKNKVQDVISAVRLMRKQPGVDPSRIILRGVSEGTLLAAEAAARIPREVSALVLSGVIGTNLKDALKFMAADGGYLAHLGHWDSNGDGQITLQEFEADSKGIGKQLPPEFAFRIWDTNEDGVYTLEEARVRMKPLVDVIEAENFDAFQPWLEASTKATVPGMRDWLKDHFTHPPIWSFLSQLTMPVGIFQGEVDANTSAAQVRLLEQQAKLAGRTNIQFQYVDRLDHYLGSSDYFLLGKNSAGYDAIFDFLKRHSR